MIDLPNPWNDLDSASGLSVADTVAASTHAPVPEAAIGNSVDLLNAAWLAGVEADFNNSVSDGVAGSTLPSGEMEPFVGLLAASSESSSCGEGDANLSEMQTSPSAGSLSRRGQSEGRTCGGLQDMHKGEAAREARAESPPSPPQPREAAGETPSSVCGQEGEDTETKLLSGLSRSHPSTSVRRPSSRLLEAAGSDLAMPILPRGGTSNLEAGRLVAPISEACDGSNHLPGPSVDSSNGRYDPLDREVEGATSESGPQETTPESARIPARGHLAAGVDSLPTPAVFSIPESADRPDPQSTSAGDIGETHPLVSSPAGDFVRKSMPLSELQHRGFDPERFLNDIDPPPLFLSSKPLADTATREDEALLRSLIGGEP